MSSTSAVRAPMRVLRVTPQRPKTPSPLSAVGLPTSSYQAVHGRGAKAWSGVAVGTLLRSAVIGAGLYAVGVRDVKQLVVGSLAASATLSAAQVTVHGIRAA